MEGEMTLHAKEKIVSQPSKTPFLLSTFGCVVAIVPTLLFFVDGKSPDGWLLNTPMDGQTRNK